MKTKTGHNLSTGQVILYKRIKNAVTKHKSYSNDEAKEYVENIMEALKMFDKKSEPFRIEEDDGMYSIYRRDGYRIIRHCAYNLHENRIRRNRDLMREKRDRTVVKTYVNTHENYDDEFGKNRNRKKDKKPRMKKNYYDDED